MLRNVFLMEAYGPQAGTSHTDILNQLRNWNGIMASEVSPGVVQLSIPTGGQGEPDIVLNFQMGEDGSIVHISPAQ
jgi:hypothetical protein